MNLSERKKMLFKSITRLHEGVFVEVTWTCHIKSPAWLLRLFKVLNFEELEGQGEEHARAVVYGPEAEKSLLVLAQIAPWNALHISPDPLGEPYILISPRDGGARIRKRVNETMRSIIFAAIDGRRYYHVAGKEIELQGSLNQWRYLELRSRDRPM